MLFNSQLFLLVFLPATLLAYYACRDQRVLREWLLILASLIFYGYWEIRLVPLLLFSIAVNWLFSQIFLRFQRRVLVVLGIVLNLAIIGVFKYADFFAGSLAWLAGSEHQPWNIILPLGISFFTFQQISYLADRQKGTGPLYGFREYCLYVSFFPQLIVGPIVRHNEFIPQLTAAIDRAMLAHHVVALSARLSLHSLRRKPFRASPSGLGCYRQDVPRGPMAWRRMDLYRMGHVARLRSSRQCGVAANGAAAQSDRRLGRDNVVCDAVLGAVQGRRFRGCCEHSAESDWYPRSFVRLGKL